MSARVAGLVPQQLPMLREEKICPHLFQDVVPDKNSYPVSRGRPIASDFVHWHESEVFNGAADLAGIAGSRDVPGASRIEGIADYMGDRMSGVQRAALDP
jgi:hypothetical protein